GPPRDPLLGADLADGRARGARVRVDRAHPRGPGARPLAPARTARRPRRNRRRSPRRPARDDVSRPHGPRACGAGLLGGPAAAPGTEPGAVSPAHARAARRLTHPRPDLRAMGPLSLTPQNGQRT